MNVRDALLDAVRTANICVSCYEIIFKPLLRALCVRWADLILNLTPATILITLKFFFSYHDPSIIQHQNPVLHELSRECVDSEHAAERLKGAECSLSSDGMCNNVMSSMVEKNLSQRNTSEGEVWRDEELRRRRKRIDKRPFHSFELIVGCVIYM